jgi:hypothetical protein
MFDWIACLLVCLLACLLACKIQTESHNNDNDETVGGTSRRVSMVRIENEARGFSVGVSGLAPLGTTFLLGVAKI